MIHILTGVDDQRRPSVQDLRDAAQSVRARITPIERLDILEEIFRVREAEEKWENGELGMSRDPLQTTIFLPYFLYSSVPRLQWIY